MLDVFIKNKKNILFFILIIISYFILIPSYLILGIYEISLQDLKEIFYSIKTSSNNNISNPIALSILLDIRLPRLVLGILCGSGLAVCGAMIQGIFRNPLVEPGLIGISSGASLFAAFAIVFLENWANGTFNLQIISFIGALLVSSVAYFVSRKNGKISVFKLLLVGIGINSIVGSLIGLIHYLASDSQLKAIAFWSMGTLASASWDNILSIFPFYLILVFLIPLLSKGLNAFILGEREAFHLGFNPEKIKIYTIILVSLCVGALVSITGIIGFIGLVVPHIARILGSSNHYFLIPASLFLGGAFLIFSDLIARILIPPAEVPIGIITSGLGGPLFLYILWKNFKEEL